MKQDVPRNYMWEVLNVFERSFQILRSRYVADAVARKHSRIVNAGLRVCFSAYSPLKVKVGQFGRPSAMWSAGSGEFGSTLK